MLTFEPITPQSAPRMRPYYADCSYHLCEYSVGVKLMWGEYLYPSFTEAAGCLIIRNELHGETLFDFPVPGEDGDVDAALTAIEDYCTQKGIAPVISVVPEQEAGRLALRYPRVHIVNERAWKDYLYRAERTLDVCRPALQRPAQPHQQVPQAVSGRALRAAHDGGQRPH